MFPSLPKYLGLELLGKALAANEPIPQRRDVSKTKLDNANDKQYKNLR